MPVTLPVEGAYSDVEQRWIATEPGGLLPQGQDSLWGQARKVFCDYMQTNLFDKLVTYWNNMNPATCSDDDIPNWEIMLGIPVNESKSIDARRAFIQIRAQRGAFTRTRRRAVVELFILATEGTPITFTPSGVPFTADGIPFFAGDFDVSTAYEIVEDIPNFTYDVRILNTIDVDLAGLQRELFRITPSPIDENFTVTQVASL